MNLNQIKGPTANEMKPLQFKNHPVCRNPFNCKICIARCYDNPNGHMFMNGTKQPCECGKYSNHFKAKLAEG